MSALMGSRVCVKISAFTCIPRCPQYRVCNKEAVQAYYPYLPTKTHSYPSNEPPASLGSHNRATRLSDRTRYLNLSICWPCSNGLSSSLLHVSPILSFRHPLLYHHHLNDRPHRCDRPSGSLCRRSARNKVHSWLAKSTDAWLGRVAARGHKSDVVRVPHR